MRKLVVLIIAMLALVVASGANADELYSNQCGLSNANRYAVIGSATYTNGSFHIDWWQNCGEATHSVELEIQRSNDGGYHWTDVVLSGGLILDTGIDTSASQAGNLIHRFYGFADSPCPSGWVYRGKVYDANGFSTDLVGAGGVC